LIDKLSSSAAMLGESSWSNAPWGADYAFTNMLAIGHSEGIFDANDAGGTGLFPVYFHDGQANISFIDGSVETKKYIKDFPLVNKTTGERM
jgi:prepilin-type processing-associated H-X9-DG protein